MKKSSLFVLAGFVFLLMFVQAVVGAPFLVCDPYPTTAQQPISFLVSFDGGTAIETGVETLADGGVRLHYDLSSLANGNHSVVVQAKDIWGRVSAPSAPFSFVKPANPPGVPSNIKIQ